VAEVELLAPARGALTTNVIFVHGLTGDPLETWRSPPPNSELWPLWLAEDLEGVAVYTIGYDAPISDAAAESMHPTDIANNLFNRLLIEDGLRQGQLVFIGHSLGGLIIKMMLRRARAEQDQREAAKDFLQRVRKVAFLATPHSGADLAGWGDFLRVLVRPSPAAISLIRNDPHLRELNEEYGGMAPKLGVDHLILTERKPLRWPVTKFGMTKEVDLGVIVKPDQADPGGLGTPIPIQADHIEIAKPASRKSEVYLFVKEFVTRPDRGAGLLHGGPRAHGAPSPPTPPENFAAVAMWRKRLDALLLAEARTTDALALFPIREGIEEAKAKIRELGGDA
jgi:pimeloyl-ACP methyl ester carboxylesterase